MCTKIGAMSWNLGSVFSKLFQKKNSGNITNIFPKLRRNFPTLRRSFLEPWQNLFPTIFAAHGLTESMEKRSFVLFRVLGPPLWQSTALTTIDLWQRHCWMSCVKISGLRKQKNAVWESGTFFCTQRLSRYTYIIYIYNSYIYIYIYNHTHIYIYKRGTWVMQSLCKRLFSQVCGQCLHFGDLVIHMSDPSRPIIHHQRPRDGINSERARTRDGTFNLFSCALGMVTRKKKSPSHLSQMACEKNCTEKIAQAGWFKCGRCPRCFGYDCGILQSSGCPSVRAVKHLNWSPEVFSTATPVRSC